MDFQRIQQFPDNEQIALNVPLKPYDGAELLKVILIDSVVPGRIVEMPISGGTVLTGKNGSGKTSFLQLISFFYGESPNKIVSSSQKLSFVQYYLPNTTSYLVFEYQRSAESKRCVAVYSDRSGERPIYRFIRQGFDRRMFIAEEAQSFIPAADLVKHLKKNGYLCEEKQIETVQDFRGIIQGVQTHSSDRQYQRYLHELTKDYSLAITHPLRQIDKVVNGMFSRTTDFDDLQNMVVACVAEENSSLHIDVDRNKFEQWPRDYRSFIAVEKEEPRYQKATELNNELISVEESLGQIKGKLRSLVKHSQVDATRTEQDRKRHEATLTTARDQMYKDKGALFETRDTNKNDAESREKTVKALENRLGDYERRDVNSAIKAINESEITYQKREDRKQKLEAIDKGHQAIVTYCELQKAVYKDRLVENMADIDRKMDQARFRAETQIAEIERDYKEKENQYIEADEQKLVILRSDLSELENKQGQSQYAYNHPTISQVLIHGKEAKNKNIIAAKNNTAKAKDVLDEHRNNYEKAKADYESCERIRAAAENNLNSEKEKLNRKIKKLNPDEGSLLHFLRTEKPDWAFDIAKVINEELLTCHDLEPSLLDETFGCYGLELNLDKLQALPESDMSELTAEIERAEQVVKDTELKLKQAETALVNANNERMRKDKDLSAYQQTFRSIQKQEATAEAELKEASRQVDQAEKEAQATAKVDLDKITGSRNDKKEELAKAQWQMKENTLSRRKQHETTLREKKNSLDRYLEECKQKKALHTQTTNEECQRLDKERDAQLKAEGIDINARLEVEAELKDLDSKIRFIDENKPFVEEYNQWMRTEYSQLNDLKTEGAAFRKAEAEAKDALNQLERDWNKFELDLCSKKAVLDKQLEKLFKEMADANRHISGLIDYRDYEFESYDAAWTLDVLVALKNQTKADESKLKEQITIELRTLLKKFREQGQTPATVYVDVQALNYDPQVSRDWLPMFKNWYEHEQAELRRLLLSESITIASSIRSFHRNMKEFNTKVQKFNRELQANLDTNLSFSSISEVCVEIVCTLTELKFWPAISEMAEIQEQWSGMAQDDLPPMNFATSLENLLESWEIKSGIRAELKNLIRIQGHVVENYSRREFRRSSDLKNISSKGLSYLILTIIFVGFINRIRKGSAVNITWAIDELKEIDIGNVQSLVDMLTRNNITLISAFPDPDPLTLELFKHSFSVDHDYGLMSAKFDVGDWGDWSVDQEEPANV